MAAARGRELRITYGTAIASSTVGSSTVQLTAVHRLRVTPDSFEISFEALLTSPTRANFDSDMATFEAALDTPRQPVLVEVLSPASQAVLHTLLSFSHTLNTGLNIECTWSKPGSRGDTIVSRRYEITVTGGRPANYLTQAGLLRDFQYDVSFPATRRGTLTVRGSYTAVGSNQAKTQYLAQIDARVLTIVTALTGTWPLASERYTPDDTDQIVSFSRVYKELIFNESSGLLDHPGVGDQQLSIRRAKGTTPAPPGSSAAGLVTIVANYSAQIDKTVTLGVSDLDTLWLNTIRPWILTNMRQVISSRGFAVTADDFSLDPVDNVLRAFVTAQAIVNQEISRLVVTDDDVDYGKILRRTWPKNAKDDLAPTPAYTFRGPKIITRIVTTTTRVEGTQSALLDKAVAGAGGGQIQAGLGAPRLRIQGAEELFAGAFGIGVISAPGESFVNFSGAFGIFGFGAGPGVLGGGGGGAARLEKLRLHTTTTPLLIGLPGEQIEVTDKVVTETFEILGSPPSINSGGGGAGGQPGTSTRTRRHQRSS